MTNNPWAKVAIEDPYMEIERRTGFTAEQLTQLSKDLHEWLVVHRLDGHAAISLMGSVIATYLVRRHDRQELISSFAEMLREAVEAGAAALEDGHDRARKSHRR